MKYLRKLALAFGISAAATAGVAAGAIGFCSVSTAVEKSREGEVTYRQALSLPDADGNDVMMWDYGNCYELNVGRFDRQTGKLRGTYLKMDTCNRHGKGTEIQIVDIAKGADLETKLRQVGETIKKKQGIKL
jgi:hypothetical protein